MFQVMDPVAGINWLAEDTVLGPNGIMVSGSWWVSRVIRVTSFRNMLAPFISNLNAVRSVCVGALPYGSDTEHNTSDYRDPDHQAYSDLNSLAPFGDALSGLSCDASPIKFCVGR